MSNIGVKIFFRSQPVQNICFVMFGLKTNYSPLLDCRAWGGKAVILSKTTWE
jgi:hypothetical protein